MRWGGIGASALLLAVAVLFAVIGGEDDAAPADAGTARIVSHSALVELADELDHPVYWIGPRPPLRTEVSVRDGDRVYLRYLPAGVPSGDPRTEFLTVGTYPVPDAAAALRRVAARAGTRVRRGAGGAVVLQIPASGGSAYLARPGSDLEVEVYDPAPGRALRLVMGGELRPVGK